MAINIIGIITLVIAFVNIYLGFAVLIKNPKKANNIVYAISVFSIAAWTICTFFYNNNIFWNSKDWLKAVYVTSYGMLLAQILFTIFFPRRIKSNLVFYLIPILLSFIPSIYVLLVKDSVILSVINKPDLYLSVAQMGADYWIYTLPNMLGIFLLAVYFYNKSRDLVGYEKAQSQFYMLGALIMMVPLTIVDYGLPLLNGDTSLFVYGPLFAIPFSLAVAYSIVENRFITFQNIFRKTITLIFHLLYITAILLLFTWVYKMDLFNGSDFYTFLILTSALGLFFYQYVFRKLLYGFVNRAFGHEIQAAQILKDFSQTNSTELSLERISVNVKLTIRDIFKISNVGVMLFDKKVSQILYKYLNDFKLLGSKELLEIINYWEDISDSPIFIAEEVKRATILEKSEVPERLQKVIDFMDQYKISAMLPLNRKTQLNGIILLGYRNDFYPLMIEDIDFMDQLISNTSVAMGRALLYQEVQSFNQTLQQKVDSQTKELQIKVQELQEARQKENDMIDIMGHELRTPATIVKLNAQLLDKFTGDIQSDPEAYKRYVDRIKMAVENEIKLINTLLSSAKLEGNKIVIDPEEVDIVNEIEMAIHGNEKDANEKNLPIINNMQPNIPPVYADKARVVEILNNLISNAVKYTDKGSVTIEGSYDDNFVEIAVVDTGNGISSEDLPKLGQKFYRAGNYIDSNVKVGDKLEIVRPGGTGLGLFVTFNLIRKMGGDIHVESEVGKGSKFIFTLPVYKAQFVHDHDGESNNMFEKLGLKKQ
jgi:signal transduction histidine kinase